jgi:hypothetical protein
MTMMLSIVVVVWLQAGPGDRLVENQCRLQAAVEKFLAQ